MVLNTRPEEPLVLVAGTGSIGQRHIRNLRQLRPHARFILLRREARRDALSDELGAKVVADVEAALALQPTLAVVASPSSEHATLLRTLMQQRVPTYIEKPIVTTLTDCSALRDMAPALLPPTQVGCVLRFLPSLRQLRQWLRERRLGRVMRATLEVGQWLPDWRPAQDYRRSYSANVAQGGGVVFDLVHEIDLACWLFGEIELLGAWGEHRSQLEIETEDVATLVLRGGDGEQIAVQLDYVSRTLVRRLHIVGDEASASWSLPERTLQLALPGREPERHTGGFAMSEAYVEAMRELLAAAETGASTSLPLHEGLRATRLAIQANIQIRSRSTP